MPAPKGNKNAKGNPGGGRKPLYKPEYIQVAKAMAAIGAIDKDIAEALGVCETTINAWKKEHVEFYEALKESKEEFDTKVVHSLFERATGYSHPDTHISNFQGEITVTPITKHYPPDPTSMIFWLKNRQSQDWKDKHEIGTDPDAPIEVHINFPKES